MVRICILLQRQCRQDYIMMFFVVSFSFEANYYLRCILKCNISILCYVLIAMFCEVPGGNLILNTLLLSHKGMTLTVIAIDAFRLEELNVIDVQFLHGCRIPTILLVHQVSYTPSPVNFQDFIQWT